MSTPYSKIINRFLRKITDYGLLEFSDDIKDEMIIELLDSACGTFERLCKSDLSLRDDNSQEFQEDLTSNEINIITEIMISEWIKPFEYTNELLENSLTTRDWNEYANSNQLRVVSAVAERIEKKCDKLMKDYSYFFGNMNNLEE